MSKIAGRWQHAKNASMVKMITNKNSLQLVMSIKVSRLTIWNKVVIELFVIWSGCYLYVKNISFNLL